MTDHSVEYGCRTRAQSEIDLVVKQGNQLRVFEIKWSLHNASARAFGDAYGVKVETQRPDNPFVTCFVA